MKSKRQPRAHGPPTTAAVRRIVDDNLVLMKDEFRALFGLSASTLRREVREGRLRIAKRAGRYFLLGRWILEWIEGGELPSRHRDEPARNGQPVKPT